MVTQNIQTGRQQPFQNQNQYFLLSTPLLSAHRNTLFKSKFLVMRTSVCDIGFRGTHIQKSCGLESKTFQTDNYQLVNLHRVTLLRDTSTKYIKKNLNKDLSASVFIQSG